MCMQRDEEISGLRKDLSSAQKAHASAVQDLLDAKRAAPAEQEDGSDSSSFTSRTSKNEHKEEKGKAKFKLAVSKVQAAARALKQNASGASIEPSNSTGKTNKMAMVVLSAQLNSQLQDARRELSERNREKVELIMEMGWLRADLDARIVERDRWKAECEELENLLEQTEEQLEKFLSGASLEVKSPRKALAEQNEILERAEQQGSSKLSNWISKLAGMVDISASYANSPSSSPTKSTADPAFGEPLSPYSAQSPTTTTTAPDIGNMERGQEWKRSLSRKPKLSPVKHDQHELGFHAQGTVSINPTSHPGSSELLTHDELELENSRLKGMVESMRSSLLEKEDLLARVKEDFRTEKSALQLQLESLSEERNNATDRCTELRNRIKSLESELEEAEARLRIRTIQFSTRLADVESKLKGVVAARGAPAPALQVGASSEASFVSASSKLGSNASLVSDVGERTVLDAASAQARGAEIGPSSRQTSFDNANPGPGSSNPANIIADLNSQLAQRARQDAHRQRELDSITKEFDRISIHLADLDSERRFAQAMVAELEKRVEELEKGIAERWDDPEEAKAWEDLRSSFMRRLEIKGREVARLREQIAELTRQRDEATVGKVRLSRFGVVSDD